MIGGDAGGMSAASTAARRDPELEVVVIERGVRTSYAACGIPYVVGGELDDLERLVVRSPQQFRDKQGFDVRMRHEAVAIDIGSSSVEVRDLDGGTTSAVPYDELLIATGARPMKPPIPGIDGAGIHTVQTLGDTAKLVEIAESGTCDRVVVVGGGYIGLEMAEAFWRRGSHVIVLDVAPQVMRTLDPDMAELVSAEMVDKGIEVRLGVTITGFEPGVVVTTDEQIAADLVILGMGVVPNGELAAEAGIVTGVKGAVSVDRRQRTSVENIWSAGDCAESFHRVLGAPVHIALGTVANRHGRVAGINIGGGYAAFPGVLGTAITRVCDLEISRTGLGEQEAIAAGFEVDLSMITSSTRAHYYPGNSKMNVKLVAEAGTGRLLGGQITGGPGAAKRIDTVATAIWAGMTAGDITDVDLSYAPPFSPVWDPVAIAARSLGNAN